MARRSSLTRFILKTIIFLVIVAVCWYFIAPFYNRALTAVSTVFIPGRAVLEQEHNIAIYSPAGMLVGGIYVLALHYGLILVIVLIAATPRMKLVRRLQAMGIAVVGIFLLNIVSIVIFARVSLSGAGAGADNPLIVLFAILGSDLFPVVIWAGLSYKYLLKLKSPRGLKTVATQIQTGGA